MAFSKLTGARFATSIGKQVDLVTPNLTPVWTLLQNNEDFATHTLNKETDANEVGSGSEFAKNEYKTSWSAAKPMTKFISSEFAAQMFGLALGKSVETPGVGTDISYAISPLQLPQDCSGIELPTLTVYETIHQGLACVALDRAYLGMAVNSLSLNLTSGPERDAAQMSVDLIGTGEILEPSTVALPTTLFEHLLPSGSAVVSVQGQNLTTLKKFVSLDFEWNNNILVEPGYFPGSGIQDGAAIMGRMEYGQRECTFAYVARFDENSTELANLKNETQGAITVQITGAEIDAGPVTHSLLIEFPQVTISTAELGNDNGVTTLQVTAMPLEASDAYCNVTVVTDTAGVAQ